MLKCIPSAGPFFFPRFSLVSRFSQYFSLRSSMYSTKKTEDEAKRRIDAEAKRRVDASVKLMRPTMEKMMERTRELLSRERNVKMQENRLKRVATEMLELKKDLKRTEQDNLAFKRDLSAHKTVLRRFKARSIEAQRTISKLKKQSQENARDEVVERFKQKILSRDAQIRYLRNRIKELEAFGSLLGADNEEMDESSKQREEKEAEEEDENTKEEKAPTRHDILEELDVSLTDESLTPEERRQILAEALQRSAHAERARCRKIFENVRARSAQKTVAEGKDTTNEESEENEDDDVVSGILRRLDRSVRTHRVWLEDFDKELRTQSKQDEEVEDSLERARALEITQMEMVRELRNYIDDEKQKEREKENALKEEKRASEEERRIWKERSESLERALEHEKERIQERLVMTMERLDRMKKRSSYSY